MFQYNTVDSVSVLWRPPGNCWNPSSVNLFTIDQPLALFWTELIESKNSHPIPLISILLLSSHLHLVGFLEIPSSYPSLVTCYLDLGVLWFYSVTSYKCRDSWSWSAPPVFFLVYKFLTTPFTSCLYTGFSNSIFPRVFFFSYGVRLSPLGTTATVWAIVPAPYDWWWSL
jgi:hypothetical protein